MARQSKKPQPEQPAEGPKSPITIKDSELLLAVGEICWLMSRSNNHRHAFMIDLEWLVIPPVILSQARLIRNGQGAPFAFVSWALVSDEVDERLKRRIARLKPADWRSGPHPWIFDVVAPFGGTEQTVTDVIRTVFNGKEVPVFAMGGTMVGAPPAESPPPVLN